MAITINGNGTLSGVTAGLTSASMPSGSVIQVVGDTYLGAVTTVTTSDTTPLGANLEVSITFASTNNKFYAHVLLPDGYNYGQATRHLDVGFQYSTDNWSSASVLGVQQVISDHLCYESSAAALFNMSVPTYGSCPTTTACKIRPFIQAGNGDVQINANTQGVHSLTVMEIAA
tara:strand:- start:57 stop:575 length:519 start_codon:yes stop_codon:yes gene_type:complete